MLDMRGGKCTLCGCEEIIQAVARDAYGQGGHFSKPMSVAVQPEGIFSGEKPIAPLTMYICRNCGFVQWFAYDPKTIPIDPERGTRLVGR